MVQPPADDRTPADRYQELFIDVQRGRVFADSKTFVDCAPLFEPEVILAHYREQRDDTGFSLKRFVAEHFAPEVPIAQSRVSPPGRSLAVHIDSLWSVLTRRPEEHPRRGSLLPLPYDYVVPGGRFAELYYWDTYFTMLGLAASGRRELLGTLLDNFRHLIDAWGRVPNGTRTYYLSRSQPPVFALMVELCERHGVREAADCLPQLLREHAFWMDGASALAPGEAFRRVVALPDGTVMNRYWDDRDTPREESWREDVATAAQSDRPAREVYRDLRAACESGWDFSSRWLEGTRLETIRTTALVPVDLNALMHRLEALIARLCRETGDLSRAAEFAENARRRHAAIDAWCWNEVRGVYVDYDWHKGVKRNRLTAATLVPLFIGIANGAQAASVARIARANLLAPGGLATTCVWSGEQWDRPNGWAPLQWLAVSGLQRYGETRLAAAIRSRWLRTVGDVYRVERKVVEKYALRELPQQHTHGGCGGEYPLQDGFGWTNGVTRGFLEARPAHDVAAGDRAPPPPDPEDREMEKAPATETPFVRARPGITGAAAPM